MTYPTSQLLTLGSGFSLISPNTVYRIQSECGGGIFLSQKICVRSRKNIEVFSSCCIQRLIQQRYSD